MLIKTVPIGKVLHKHLLNFLCQLHKHLLNFFCLALLITVLLIKKLKNKQKNMNVCIHEIIRLIIIKIKTKMKNRSHRYDMDK